MLYGNILWDLDSSKYRLIDFEYSGFNLIGADITNVLTETTYLYDAPQWPGFERNPKLFGKLDHVMNLVKIYLAYLKLYLYRRTQHSKGDYISKVPESLKKILKLDLEAKYFEEEVKMLDMPQNKELNEKMQNSAVIATIDQQQIDFIMRLLFITFDYFFIISLELVLNYVLIT